MTKQPQPILEARNIFKDFKSSGGFFAPARTTRAVNDVSLTVRRGETFAIVGESGSGKSTLGRILLNLLQASSGEVLIDGQPISGKHGKDLRALRSRAQIVFQDPFSSLNPRMTVADIIGEPIWLHKDIPARARMERVRELMNLVGLRADHAGRYPHEFSGGQRQRIAIARAIASGPELLLGDEPVSALDVSIQAQIINLLQDLKIRLGLTLIIVSHDLAVIRHMSDRVAVMYLGRVVEMGNVGAVYSAPRHPYTRALLDAVPVAHPSQRGERNLLQGEIPAGTIDDKGCAFAARCPLARDACRSLVPPLSGDEHLSACHFSNELPVSTHVNAADVISPVLSRRLELYRTMHSRVGAEILDR